MLAASVVGSVAGCAMACNTALAQGTLVAHGKDLALQAPTGETNVVVWPSGYSVREDNGSLALADRFGSVKARAGDRIGVAGGFGVDNVFHGCGDVWIEAPVPTSGLPGTTSTLRT
jgi:hypothetical protein